MNLFYDMLIELITEALLQAKDAVDGEDIEVIAMNTAEQILDLLNYSTERW